MTGTTHIAVGIATALVVTRPETPGRTFAAIIGGAIGGIICDIDSKSHHKSRAKENRRAWILTTVIVLAALVLDIYLQAGVFRTIVTRHRKLLLAGIVIIIGLGLSGKFAKPKTMAHSFLYIAELCIGFYCLCPAMVIPFGVAGLSHILLDLVNKKPVQVFYPVKKGFCFNWCYPDATANTVLLIIGSIIDVGLIGLTFYHHIIG